LSLSSGASIITRSGRTVRWGIKPRRSLLAAPSAVRYSGRATPSLRPERLCQTSNQWQDSTYDLSSFWGQVMVNAPLSGLFRSELLVPLPMMPTNSQLTSAVLGLNFAGSSGTNGNSTFGPLSVYYSSSHNTLTFNTTDYSSSDFVLVTNSFLTPDSPPAIYNLDVTRQVATNYAINSGSQFLAFRFQVDGLQYQGGNHYYEFSDFVQDNPFPQFPTYYPAQLTLQFSQLSSPSISCLLNQSLGLLFLHWPVVASNYVLESANTLDSASWNTVTNSPLTYTNNNEIYVGVAPTNNQCFFRLRQQ